MVECHFVLCTTLRKKVRGWGGGHGPAAPPLGCASGSDIDGAANFAAYFYTASRFDRNGLSARGRRLSGGEALYSNTYIVHPPPPSKDNSVHTSGTHFTSFRVLTTFSCVIIMTGGTARGYGGVFKPPLKCSILHENICTHTYKPMHKHTQIIVEPRPP